jgi:O-antigen ligase
MYLAVVFFLIFTFFRLHEFVPPLKAARPLLICAMVIAYSWVASGERSVARDPIFRAELAFLMLVLVGVLVAVNHYWWLQTTIDFLTHLIVFTLGLATVIKHPPYRRHILLLLLSAFTFLAIWSLRHAGFGPRDSWLYDENDLAAALVVGACLGYGFATEANAKRLRWAGLITGIVCLSGVIATLSRGGFVALVAAVAAIAFFSGRLIRTVFVSVLATIVLLPLVPQQYLDEVLSIDEAVDTYGMTGGQEMERIYTWRRGWEMFMAHPIIGVGAGNFPWAVSKFESTPKATIQRGARRQIAGRAAHSLYFTLLPETGIAGAIAFLTIVGTAISRAKALLQRRRVLRDDDSSRIVAILVGPGLVSYLVAGAFISVLWYPMIWLLIGFALSIPNHTQAGDSTHPSPTPTTHPNSRPRRSRQRQSTHLTNRGDSIDASALQLRVDNPGCSERNEVHHH